MAAAATTNGIETPQKFLPGAGPPPIPWNEWRPLFENYCDAIFKMIVLQSKVVYTTVSKWLLLQQPMV